MPRHHTGARSIPASHPGGPISTPTAAPASTDHEVLTALRAGDEDAFRSLVCRHQPGLRRVARTYVPDAIADEIVQETWTAVITGLTAFEGRSSLKTWIYSILLNIARKRGAREARIVPFSSRSGQMGRVPTVEPERLVHPELGRGYWPDAPPSWHDDPEHRLLSDEILRVARAALDELPAAQREVVTLRDVEGWNAAEVCDLLGLSSVNQRVLLHRGRAVVRRRLEEYLGGT